MARYEKTLTVVECARLNEELPALERAPFPGELGARVYENISQLAYRQWQEQATILINHYGLNMADPSANEFLFEQMEAYLFSGGENLPANMTPEDAAVPSKK